MSDSISRTHIFTGHSGAVYSIDVDSNFIYSASADKFVVRWDIKRGIQDKFAIKLPNTPYSIKLFNQDKYLAVGLSNGDLHFFDIEQKKEIRFYQQHSTGVFGIFENINFDQLVVSDAGGNISVWDTSTFELIIYLPFDCGKIRRITSSLDGGTLYLACQDGMIRSVDAITFNELSQFTAHKDGVTSVTFLSEKVLLSGGKDAYLKLWDVTTNQVLQELPAHNFVIYDCLVLNEHRFVTASRDKTIKMWDTDTLKVVERIDIKKQGHKHSVNQLRRIDDSRFASCSDDGMVMVWQVIQSQTI